MGRRNLFLALIVACSAIAGAFSVWTASQLTQKLRTDPDLYAQRNTYRLGRLLGLTGDQKLALKTVLRKHRQDMNAVDRDEIQFWEMRYAEFGNVSHGEWNASLEKGRHFADRRLQLRQTIHTQLAEMLTPQQQKQFAQFMIQRLDERKVP